MFNVKKSDKMWVVCEGCGKAIDISKGGKCRCSNMDVKVNKDGTSEVHADDSDKVVYDNS